MDPQRKSFREGTQICAILGYGIPIFDSDLIFKNKEDNPKSFEVWTELQNIIENDDFIKFIDAKNISIKKWKCEDQDQIWIVDNNSYCETGSFEDLGQISKEDEDTRIEIVYKKLFQLLKDKMGIEVSYDNAPQWGLHLYYE